jgi:hypothetical protein
MAGMVLVIMLENKKTNLNYIRFTGKMQKAGGIFMGYC